MRVYQSGAMRSRPLFNFPAFEDGQRYLEWLGHEVVSPHESDLNEGWVNARYGWARDREHGTMFRVFADVWLSDKFNLPDALRRDLDLLLSCDAVSFLPGSKVSLGARFERAAAEAAGLPIFVHEPRKYFYQLDGPMPRSAVIAA